MECYRVYQSKQTSVPANEVVNSPIGYEGGRPMQQNSTLVRSDSNGTSTGACGDGGGDGGEDGVGSLWYVGVGLSVAASITSNLGISFQKLSMMLEQDKPGELQRPYICQPRWTLGLFAQIFGSVGDFAALAFAPQSLCAPVGGTVIVANIFSARFLLGETMSKLDLAGSCVVTVGVVASALFADKSPQCFTMQDLLDLYTTTHFAVYIICLSVLIVLLFVFVKFCDRVRERHGSNSEQYIALVRSHR